MKLKPEDLIPVMLSKDDTDNVVTRVNYLLQKWLEEALVVCLDHIDNRGKSVWKSKRNDFNAKDNFPREAKLVCVKDELD